MWEVTHFGVGWGDFLPALPFTNSLTSVRRVAGLSLRLSFLIHEGGIVNPTLPLGGQKQMIMIYEERLCRLKGAGKESVSDVTIRGLIMSFHWASKGTCTAMEAESEQGV